MQFFLIPTVVPAFSCHPVETNVGPRSPDGQCEESKPPPTTPPRAQTAARPAFSGSGNPSQPPRRTQPTPPGTRQSASGDNELSDRPCSSCITSPSRGI